MEKINTILRKLLQEAGNPELVLLAEIDNRWSEIVGEALAERVRPHKMSRATLYLAAESPVWSQEAFLMKDLIKQRVKESVGYELSEIRMSSSAPVKRPQEQPPASGSPDKDEGAERDPQAMLARAKKSWQTRRRGEPKRY
jgi:predicted nucleic acid-binding Zn ribbon protein